MASEQNPTANMLQRFVETDFFETCQNHNPEKCNWYCLTCNFGPMCCVCKFTNHQDHRTTQIFSFHNIASVKDIALKSEIDVSDIGDVVTDPRDTEKASQPCRICGKKLPNPYRYCSLQCKVDGLKVDDELASFELGENSGEATPQD